MLHLRNGLPMTIDANRMSAIVKMMTSALVFAVLSAVYCRNGETILNQR